MNEERNKFLDLINLKGQLINFNSRELVELYNNDYDGYVIFLNSVEQLIDNELAFLLLNNEEYIDKILTVASAYRFSKDDSNVKKIVNRIIVAMNEIIDLSEEDKYAYRYNYLVEQENLRDTGFYEEDEFIAALSFDSFLAHVLQRHNPVLLEACNNEATLKSLKYMSKVCPEFFNDEEVMKNTMSKLDSITSKSNKNQLKRKMDLEVHVDDIKERIVKVYKKGE
ncbi:MAG: hypothetical protein IKE63_01270 [Bacilli bacterium]|nr:hypothetical protein [Bacilli bacterium]